MSETPTKSSDGNGTIEEKPADLEKKVRALKKKVRQCESLLERCQNGEGLDKDQQTKLDNLPKW